LIDQKFPVAARSIQSQSNQKMHNPFHPSPSCSQIHPNVPNVPITAPIPRIPISFPRGPHNRFHGVSIPRCPGSRVACRPASGLIKRRVRFDPNIQRDVIIIEAKTSKPSTFKSSHVCILRTLPRLVVAIDRNMELKSVPGTTLTESTRKRTRCGSWT
jgi:hypothetical protein